MSKISTLALLLAVIGMGSVIVVSAYSYSTYSSWQDQQGMMERWRVQAQPSNSITLEQARTIAQQYLASTQNPNLGIKEIMEFQNNFYVMYYEKDTGVGAFEMLIWKQAPSSGMMGGSMGIGGGMMGYGMVAGTIVPEPGPNMMWNTKYSIMQGMMGSRGQTGTSGQMQVSEQEARSVAETYLSQNFLGTHVEGITRFYGYYTIDFQKDGKIVGMLSVNGYTHRVWYHSWHGAFLQEIELS
jgi:hypothetical protein